jgi:hypothetical protein
LFNEHGEKGNEMHDTKDAMQRHAICRARVRVPSLPGMKSGRKVKYRLQLYGLDLLNIESRSASYMNNQKKKRVKQCPQRKAEREIINICRSRLGYRGRV